MPGRCQVVDPVEAYDRLAPVFDALTERRNRYLRSIENLIVARVPADARSLIDVGAGDGSRAVRIANGAGIRQVVLVEPSVEMARRAGRGEVWPVRAEALAVDDPRVAGRRFDVVTCLWNVLGHVRPEAARIEALRRMGLLATPRGRLFLDVTHRYNLRSYGFFRTVVRRLRDSLSFSERSGDVVASWALGESPCATYGHVFTDDEVRELAAAAGLVVEERRVVDYDTGQTRRWGFSGNLLYVMRRGS
jgi:2-polyprenyl-3-methyl-5-hydroxy-6-metoxy-1,4-benzoquinol methylase